MTQSNSLKNFVRLRPNGDTHERQVCDTCGFIDYQNPKIVVGSVVRYNKQVLMCRRAISPSKGLWTLPAGYLEIGETVEEGAKREAWEEACADIRIDAVLAVYSLAHIGQVQIMHLATLEQPHFAAGEESLEVDLFNWDHLPLEELAFPSVLWTLNHARIAMDSKPQLPFREPPVQPDKAR
ncbi:MAG: NUDIX hydrolase [Pseudomonadota bacterium]